MDEADDQFENGKPNAALTRREWLLSLGSAVVLAGCSGGPGEAGAVPGDAGALPPGLYVPSLDHLTHALTSDELFHPIPAGSQTDYIRPRSGPFVPQAFTPREFPMIRRLVEIILGEDLTNPTETPISGAPATIYDEVAEWIDLVVASGPGVRAQARALPAPERAVAVGFFGSEEPLRALETFAPEQVCRAGLTWLGEESRRRFDRDFTDAGAARQVELVNSMSDAAADQAAASDGTRFYHFLKAESIRGFYTSRRGLKELDYKGNSFYAESPACTLSPHPPE